MDHNAHNSKSDFEPVELKRLHRWLSYNRYTIFIYGGGFFIPGLDILFVLTVLAIAITPYTLYVLYRNHKRGWLLFFAIMVGIPTVLAFMSTGNVILDTGLHFLPLLAFYAYCFLLRVAVDDWISEASPVTRLWVQEQEKGDKSGE